MSSGPGEGRMGMVEKLASILQSLTLQNVLVFCILVAIAIPAYGVWQLLHDTDLRKEVLSYAKDMDLGVPCQTISYSFAGQTEKSAVLSNVKVVGHREIIVGTRIAGPMTQSEAADACKQMISTAEALRVVLSAAPDERGPK